MSFVWNEQHEHNESWIFLTIKQSLLDQFQQSWNSKVKNSPESLNYRLYKEDFGIENYFRILDDKNIITLCRFRTLNNNLPIESGRWQNISRENRKCHLCNSGDIGDEFHYLFKCTSFDSDRISFSQKKC